ncbi:unnamed protein product [Clonostachys byssicola]|uniref:Ring-like domain-containing protein n=1 Tax=Clonostachys byssicola TaxID=160290 RepID=A0A9N9YAP3_9HYPO|nr:unnamed protein product [Clonostachys byssicola]
MLEYFTIRKIKKVREEKKAQHGQESGPGGAGKQKESHAPEASGSSHSQPAPGDPILDRSDEAFLRSLLSDDGSEDGPAPPLPPRVPVPEIDWPSDDASSMNRDRASQDGQNGKAGSDGKGKSVEEEKKPNRLSRLFSKRSKHGSHLKPEDANAASLSEGELQKEKRDLNNVLDRLNLSAKNNKVINLSNDSEELLAKFTQVFKDLANGVPTAYDDLVKLFTDRDGTISKCFEKLPSGLQKLVMQLPEKVTGSIAPEILAAAAKSQGLEASMEGGIKEAASNLFVPKNLLELVTKPGALVSMLRAIVSTLQARWPAFIGVNVIWSVALFLLMFVLWYCYKRGKEVRLEKEAQGVVDGADRIEELPDDPQLPAPAPRTEPLVADSATGSGTRTAEASRPNGPSHA